MAELNLGHVVGPGVPTGGTSGQVLKKNSSTNFDTSWSANDATTIPMSSSDSTSINEAIAHSVIGSSPITIANGTDLNTITTPGYYVCAYNASVATLSNCPISVAFTMQVIRGTTNENAIQILIAYHDGITYKRVKHSTTWGSWISLEEKLANINSHSDYASSIVTDNVTINTAYKKTLADFVTFYLDFDTTSAKSAMDNVMHGLPNAINGSAYTVTVLGHTPDREPTTYKFSMTGDGYLKTLDAIPNGTRIRLTLAYFTA